MESLETSLTCLDRLLFDGPGIRMGIVAARPHHPSFRDDGPSHHNAIQFQRLPVVLERRNGEFLADTHVATFFRPGEPFKRRAAHPDGEESFWIAFDPGLLDEMMPAWMECRDAADGTFVDDRTFLAQWRLRGYLTRPAVELDPLWVEEAGLWLIEVALGTAHPALHRESQASSPTRQDVGLAEAVRQLLNERFREPLRLASIGAAVGYSPYHLARRFRKVTGTSIHSYRTSLRLREGLERLSNGESDISGLALEIGFSSHSHFCERFRAAFGITPSTARRVAARGRPPIGERHGKPF